MSDSSISASIEGEVEVVDTTRLRNVAIPLLERERRPYTNGTPIRNVLPNRQDEPFTPDRNSSTDSITSSNRKRRRSLLSQQSTPMPKKLSPDKTDARLSANKSNLVDEEFEDFDDDSLVEDIMNADIADILSPQKMASTPKRNGSLKYNEHKIVSIPFEAYSIRAGKTVQIQNEEGFLFVVEIIQNIETGKVRLRGHNLERCRHLNGMFELKRNELCWLQEIDEDDNRPQQSLREIALEDVFKIRLTRFTNEKFTPDAWKRGISHLTKADAETEGCLMVRYKMTTWWPTARIREAKLCHFPTRAIEMLTQSDLEFLKVSFTPGVDAAKRLNWRGETILGGSYVCDEERKSRLSIVNIDLTGARSSATQNKSTTVTNSARRSSKAHESKPKQKYTYFDAFCGAGGATRGAVYANLHIQYGFDKDEWAAISWRLNFERGSTIFYEMEAFHMITDQSLPDLKCDIVHLSPPCQYFSPAHTVAGSNDEENFAALWACGRLLDRIKPRMGTLEQTQGLANLKFRSEFNSIVQDFVKRGYSVRWKLCSLPKWGLPQRRTRLLMIFAGPGEILPDFPPYTHADPVQGLKGLTPFVTMNDAFRTIPANHPLHNTHSVKRHDPPKPQYSGDQIAPRCITTSGGQNYHPDGERNLTFAEFAVAQGFPLNHRFSERCVTKQIGNAYAPNIAAVVFRHIRKALQKADGLEPDELEEMEEADDEVLEEKEEDADFREIKVINVDDDDEESEQRNTRNHSLIFMGLAEKKKKVQARSPGSQLSVIDLSIDDGDKDQEIVDLSD